MVIIKISANNKCWRETGEKGISPTLLLGMEVGEATMEIPQKTKNGITL